MSELTYKKITDVDIVEALNDDTTVFVNDNGAMKQLDTDKLGTVKTVNGVEPDENGDIKSYHSVSFNFADGSAIVPGLINYYGAETMAELCDYYAQSAVYNVECRRMIMTNDGTIQSRNCIGDEIVKDADGNVTGRRLFFGDNLCPVILDIASNKIIFDPDWVAPEADPEPTGAHQILVTDAEGKQLWEERTHWADSTLDVVLPEVTIDKKTAYLNDYASYTRNLQQGHTYHVVCDGAEYQCSPVWNDILYSYTIGNASLASLGSDTGEPFFINAHYNMQMTIIYFSQEGQHTIAIDEGVINTIHTLDPKYLPEDHINSLIDSNEKITALTEEKMNLPQENGAPNYGTAGQFAISDGKGGITWKTLVEAEAVMY